MMEEARASLEIIEERLESSRSAAIPGTAASSWVALKTLNTINTAVEADEPSSLDNITGYSWAKDLLALSRAPPPPPGTLLSRPFEKDAGAAQLPCHPLYAICSALFDPTASAHSK